MLLSHEKPRQDGSDQHEHFMGFTHLIPISEGTYHDYIRGKISDTDFNASLVCSPDQEAHAILVFSLGLDLWRLKEIITGRRLGKVDRLFKKVGLPPFQIGSLHEAEEDLWRGFFYHAQVLLRQQRFSSYPVIFLAQSLNASVKRVLRISGFIMLDGRISADGEELFEIKLWPPPYAKRNSR
jgi:hypothetical protein